MFVEKLYISLELGAHIAELRYLTSLPTYLHRHTNVTKDGALKLISGTSAGKYYNFTYNRDS